MRKGLVTLAVGAVAVVMLAGFRFAGWGGWHGRDPARIQQVITKRVDHVLDRLEATAPQREQVHALAGGLFQEGRTLMEAGKGTRQQVLTEWDSPRPDANRLHALVDARVDGFRAFGHSAVEALVRFHDILTPAQRAQVSEHARERGGHH